MVQTNKKSVVQEVFQLQTINPSSFRKKQTADGNCF